MYGLFTIRSMSAVLKSAFPLDDLPEVFLSNAAISRKVGAAVKAGGARKLGPRLYTRNMHEPLEQVSLRNWQRIAAGYFPGAVVVDRSAFEAKPSDDGSLFLDTGTGRARREAVRLPGLTLRPRRGPGSVEGDMPFMDGLHFSGPARKFLDNLRPSRTQNGGIARTLSRVEIEERLARMVALRGIASLNELRDQARRVAPALGAEAEMEELGDLIGAVLGTGAAPLSTASARAHGRGEGFDPRRIELLDTLRTQLQQQLPPTYVAQKVKRTTLSFFEAYFSNFIEGTEFEVSEAEGIVFGGVVPTGRFEDAHDVLGTFEVIDDPAKRGRVPADGAEFVEQLRADHAVILGNRPAADPGRFKERANRAGGTSFVHPDLVNGTLIEGFRHYLALPEGFPRAAFMMFLIAEVHPFTDGNGRTARVFMNAELTAAGLQRIVIPISYRDDYLQGLRALSLGGDPKPLVRVLEFAQRYAAGIDWSDLRRAERMLAATNAFVLPHLADEQRRRLRLPLASDA
ncbi:MAG: filamentation induced by cAMP protein Fic [Solirubrobacterales bacterium]|nr:filamentation induced by cAMP protein Fic [Solirubrobacterales bacterium]